MTSDSRDSEHVTDHDLERYHLGMIVEETELAALEEHLLACSACAERAQATANYIDAMRRAIAEGDHDL
jgi:anti-sigma factor RsiW